MLLRNFLWLRFIVASWANNIDMIRDYFLFKEVPTVVGFTCADSQNNYKTVKLFNDVGISISLEQISPNVKISRSLRANFWKIGVFMDLRCRLADEDIVKIFDEASASHMFRHLHQWLILENSTDHVVQLLNDTTFSVLTDLVISLPRNDGFMLYDIYNPCKQCGGSLTITEFGNWTENDGLNVTLLENKFSRRRNFHQLRVKCGGILLNKGIKKQLIEYLQDHGSTMDTWSKYGYALLLHIAYMYNFTPEIIAFTEWDVTESNGPLFGAFRDRIIDIAYFPSVITLARSAIADISLQVWPGRTCFMFRTLPSTKINMNIIFRPFEKYVWYMTCLLSIIMMVTLLIILKINGSSNWSQIIFVIIAALSQQGLSIDNNRLSSRIACLQSMLFGLLVYNYYSAAIVSSRLNNIPLEKMNDSLRSLAHSKLKLSAHETLTFHVLLRHSPTAEIQYFQAVWDKIPDDKKFLPLEEGVKRIMTPGFAYHADPVYAYPIIERVFSNEMILQLTEVHLQRPTEAALFATKNGQLGEVTKIGLIRTITAGLRKRELISWASRKPFYNKANQAASSVTITETMPMIIVLLFGMAVSIIICIVENVVFRLSQMKRKVIIRAPIYNEFYKRNVMVKKLKLNQTKISSTNIKVQGGPLARGHKGRPFF